MRKPAPYIVATLGIIAASFAAIFIKRADDAPALVIAAYRLLFAVILMTPFSIKKTAAARSDYTKSMTVWNIVSGIVLALHFACWIGSLKYNAVARSVILVSTSPFFVSIFGRIFLKEKINLITVIGMLLSFCGIIIMSVWNSQLNDGTLFGDLLALGGAFFAGLYFLIGRTIRQTISTTVYAYVTYGFAAVVLIGLVLVTGNPWTGYRPFTYLMFFLLAAVPQIIGHTSLNYALKYLPVVSVAVVTLGEPLGASFLAWIILKESVSLATLLGGAVVLIGVFLTVYSKEKESPKAKGPV